jgi:hypothetical protein
MKQIILDSLNHPLTAAGAGTASTVAQGQIDTGHGTINTIIQILTFVIGIAPAVKQLFKKKQKVS